MLGFVAACLIVLPGPVIEPFGPEGAWEGHWGVDVAMAEGAIVAAPLAGVVSFAGEVTGVRTVTIRSGNFRVSMSYLATVEVRAGVQVERGDRVGTAGSPHGTPGLHIGLRRGDRYLDPALFARCGPGQRGILRLLPPMLPTPVSKD